MKKKISALLLLLMILNGCSNADSRDEIFRQNLYANENLSISQDEISLAEGLLVTGMFVLEVAALIVDVATTDNDPPRHYNKHNGKRKREFNKH